jgi:ABC-type bacteriocin/lantibiotic exporter with double-glycine peptidase domain
MAGYFQSPLTADDWERLLPADQAPFSVEAIVSAARAAGLEVIAVAWDDPAAADLDAPCLLHVRAEADDAAPNHFVVCFGERDGHVCLADYPGGPVMTPRPRVYPYWSGTAIYVGAPGDQRIRDLHWRVQRPTMIRAAGVLVVAAAGLYFLMLNRQRWRRPT